MGLTVSDNFSLYPDQNPFVAIGKWTNDAFWGNLKIVSGVAVTQSGGGSAAAYWSADSFDADQFSEIIPSGGFAEPAPMVRYTPGGNAYFAFFTSNQTIDLYRYNAGAGALLHSFGAGDSVPIMALGVTRLKLQALGQTPSVTLRILINDVQYGADVVDNSGSRLLSGYVGIHCFSTVNGVASFRGGNIFDKTLLGGGKTMGGRAGRGAAGMNSGGSRIAMPSGRKVDDYMTHARIHDFYDEEEEKRKRDAKKGS